MPTLSETAKVAIVTALISTIGTILVGFIAVLPAMRQQDQNNQKELPREDIYTISGRIQSTDNSPLSGAELYAAKAADSAIPGDDGRFLFENVLRSTYRVIVVDQTGQIRRLLIDPDESPPQSEGSGITITYSFVEK